MEIPVHRLPLRDYQKEFLANVRDVRQAVLVWARRGAKTYTVFVEHIIPRMFEESMNVVIVYPTAKQGFKNFWTNIENDGFKTLEHIPKDLVVSQSNSENDMRITLQDYIDEYGSDFLYRQEVLLDWGQSSLTSYYGDLLYKAKTAGRIGDHPYDARYPVYTSWDLGGGKGTTAILFWQYINKELRIIDQHATHDIGDEAIAKFILGKPYNYGWHYWPHDGARADSDIVSRIAKIREHGLINTSLLIRKGKEDGINRTIDLLRKPTTTIHLPTCEPAVEQWKLYQRKYNEFTGDYEGPEHKTESHISDALRYCAEAIDQSFDPVTGKNYMSHNTATTAIDPTEDWNAEIAYAW
jgi:hypothetical protein